MVEQFRQQLLVVTVAHTHHGEFEEPRHWRRKDEELLFRILQVLFTEEEAALVALLPIRPFTAAAAARNWKRTEAEALAVLESLASRGMLLDIELEDGRYNTLGITRLEKRCGQSLSSRR